MARKKSSGDLFKIHDLLLYTNMYISRASFIDHHQVYLLVLDLVDEGTNVRQQLDGEFVTSLDELLGVLGGADTGRGTSQDDGTSGESGALRKEADELGNVEDEVTVWELWLA